MDWPHSPVHRLSQGGTYMVTCGTHRKEHLFTGEERLSILHDSLLSLASQYRWRLQAWAVFSNHYHFVAISPDTGKSLPRLLSHLHTVTASKINERDDRPGRKVWFQYWDSLLTFEESYLARINYVQNNPVKHGLVTIAVQYPWCSAGWFERAAEKSFYQTVSKLKIDRLNVRDDFDPEQCLSDSNI